MAIALTTKGNTNSRAKEYVEYLKSKEAQIIFKKHGWK